MSDLIAIGYPDEATAEAAAEEARRLAKDLIIEPDAIAVIVRDADGDYHVHTRHHMAGSGATWGMFWGLLFGLLFFIPVFGMAIGAGLGALMGKVTKSGIDAQFQDQVRGMLQPGTSALFLMVEKVTPDKAVEAMSRYGGTVLKASLSKEGERELQDALTGGNFEARSSGQSFAPPPASPPRAPADHREETGHDRSWEIDASFPDALLPRLPADTSEPAGADFPSEEKEGVASQSDTAAAHFLVADMPPRCRVGTEFSVIVRISADRSHSFTQVVLKPFDIGLKGANITLTVLAPAELRPTEPLQQVLLVPRSGDSEPTRFAFRAEQVGAFRLRINAFAGGTFLGDLDVQVSVEEDSPPATSRTISADLDSLQGEPGEVTLQVRFDGAQYLFQLLSDSCLFEPVLAEALTAQPGQAVSGL